jgi:two-component system, OmpR family, sensor histidine kinase AdeS
MKHMRKPLSLKTLFALASTACVLSTVVIGYFGLSLYGDYQFKQIQASFSPAAKRAQAQANAQQTPSPEDVKALVKEWENVGDDIETGQNWALVVLSIFASGLGAGLSLLLADRLGRPITAVADAAREIAKGTLSARAQPSTKDVGESSQLISDFNQMATALEGFEREMNESSAAIAHELRTPLTVLRGYVQGSIDGVFPPTQAHMKLLLVHIESLSRVVDDLQILSLANVGGLRLSFETFDAAREVGAVLDSMEPALKAAGLTVERALDVTWTHGDAARLRQAVTALIDNARHYAASGGVIKVQTQATKSGVIIRVLDRGPGIAQDDLARGFERFWRAEPSRGKHSGGSGLGLSVVKAIVSAHGGTARLTNRPSGGLCVELTLPRDHATL